MILLDTNVLSALMQHAADRAVVAWLDAQPAESIWTTSITVFEIRFGLDQAAAQSAGAIAAVRRRAGQTVEIRDVQIAGIALARRAALATRNVRHFEGLGISLIDPWSAGS